MTTAAITTNKYDAFKMKVSLPSGGRPYGDSLPSGDLETYPITTKEEEIMATGSNNLVKSINQVVSRLLILPQGLDYNKLLLIDRFFLLLKIRENTYGPDYHLKFNCPACGKLSDLHIDLANLSVTFADENWVEPFPAKLPISGKSLMIRMLRVEDEIALENLPKSKVISDLGSRDQSYRSRIARQIVSIDGDDKMNTIDKMRFVTDLHGMDSSVIDNVIRDHELGPDDIRFVCSIPSCQRETDITFPMSPEFFRPRTSTTRRA